MPILHPIFIAIFVLLAIGSYVEIFRTERKQPLFAWLAAILIIIAVGFRVNVGADYPIYRMLFTGFALYTSYGDVFSKAMFQPVQ